VQPGEVVQVDLPDDNQPAPETTKSGGLGDILGGLFGKR
jgi:hypothetical protein